VVGSLFGLLMTSDLAGFQKNYSVLTEFKLYDTKGFADPLRLLHLRQTGSTSVGLL